MTDHEASDAPTTVYAELRDEFSRLMLAASADELAVVVPQCPDWTAQDVLAHVVGITDDFVNGRLEGVGSDPWTEAQVVSRRGRTAREICEEWESLGSAIDERTASEPFLGVRLTADLVTHLHDVLTAWGRRGDRDSAAVRMGLDRYGPFFCERAAAAGLPPVEVRAGGRRWCSADEEPAAVLQGSAFELLRAFSGRRSAAQVLAMEWTGDPDPYVAVVTPYGLPAEDVIEP